ncbi:MAG: hypothetical protein HYY16_04720 [Planctomycetes bacterium]|nr:hypothetical protein [Planctomycetota bacterium]
MIVAHRYGAAIRAMDEFPVRQASEPDAALRIAHVREEAVRKAEEQRDARANEAETMASEGRLREAVDRLVDLDMPSLVGPAYDRLRASANRWLVARRQETHERVEREMNALAARYEAAPAPSDPGHSWKEAERLAEADRWEECVGILTSLARVPAWRDRALEMRAVAHAAAEQFIGVLVDVRTLLESDSVNVPALDVLIRAVMRAPVDETAVRLCERALERNPHRPAVWETIVLIHTWRHDTESAARTVEAARARRVRFSGAQLDTLDLHVQLRERGFAPGRAVYVDYAGPYEILTDTSPQRARAMALKLAAIGREYEALFPWSRNPNLRFRVMSFAHTFDYDQYYRDISRENVTAQQAGVGAWYSPGVKQLVMCEELGEIEEVLRHEGYHQWLDCYAPDAPAWFNEGTASYMETCRDGRLVGLSRYVYAMPEFLDRMPSFKRLLMMSPAEWYRLEDRWMHYCQSATFVTFLRVQGKGRLLDEYLRLLVMGVPGDVASRRVFGCEDLDALEEAWKDAVAPGGRR